VSRRPALFGLGALASATLAAGLAGPAAAGDGGGGPAARASDCAWHKHTKRIVRHVRRHGKRRRVVRVKHWWTCEPVLSGGPARLGVKAFEYSYVLSRRSVAPGEVIVELDNEGEDPHNLNIAPTGSTGPPLVHFEDTASLQRTQKRFSLAPGTYELWCDLPEHEALGMHATLSVNPS
jgi:plastocyanin